MSEVEVVDENPNELFSRTRKVNAGKLLRQNNIGCFVLKKKNTTELVAPFILAALDDYAKDSRVIGPDGKKKYTASRGLLKVKWGFTDKFLVNLITRFLINQAYGVDVKTLDNTYNGRRTRRQFNKFTQGERYKDILEFMYSNIFTNEFFDALNKSFNEIKYSTSIKDKVQKDKTLGELLKAIDKNFGKDDKFYLPIIV